MNRKVNLRLQGKRHYHLQEHTANYLCPERKPRKPICRRRQVLLQARHRVGQIGVTIKPQGERDNSTLVDIADHMDLHFGRMRFRRMDVTLESNNNNIEEKPVPTPPSAPKPASQGVTVDEQNSGKVRRQWQRDSVELVMVTQNQSVSPRSDVTDVQAQSKQPVQQHAFNTSDPSVHHLQQDAMLQTQIKAAVTRRSTMPAKTKTARAAT